MDQNGNQDQAERLQADAGCEEQAARMIAQGLSPEEYAARFGHDWYCFSLGDYRYRDPAVDAWMARLNEILFGLNGAPTLEELRQKFLSPEERLQIERRINEEL